MTIRCAEKHAPMWFENYWITSEDISHASKMSAYHGAAYLCRVALKASRSQRTAEPVQYRDDQSFTWPHPLVPQYKIKNLKAYREYHHCSLSLALAAYNKETEQLCLF